MLQMCENLILLTAPIGIETVEQEIAPSPLPLLTAPIGIETCRHG